MRTKLPKEKFRNIVFTIISSLIMFLSHHNCAVANDSISSASILPTATLITQQQSYNKTFERIDNFMSLPQSERILMRYENKTAYTGAGQQVFSPTFIPDEKAGIWAKSYSLFENIPVGNGPTISNVGYGTIMGYDTDLKHFKNNLEGGITYHVSFDGSRENYDNVKSIDTVGTAGVTGALFKNNFFTALTLSSGGAYTTATIGEGNHSFNTFIAGAAWKSGYNFEFQRGKYILQPSFLATYTFEKISDFTSSEGKKTKINNINAMQIIPGVKLIANLKNGWQPYLGLSIIWDLMDSPAIYEDEVLKQRVNFAPFCEYGGGLQRKWKDRYTAFGQIMMRGGGRNGISIYAGGRFALGK